MVVLGYLVRSSQDFSGAPLRTRGLGKFMEEFGLIEDSESSASAFAWHGKLLGSVIGQLRVSAWGLPASPSQCFGFDE